MLAQPSRFPSRRASLWLSDEAIRGRAPRFECAPTRDSRQGLRTHLRHWRETTYSRQIAAIRELASGPASPRRDSSGATDCEEYPRDWRLPAPDLNCHASQLPQAEPDLKTWETGA